MSSLGPLSGILRFCYNECFEYWDNYWVGLAISMSLGLGRVWVIPLSGFRFSGTRFHHYQGIGIDGKPYENIKTKNSYLNIFKIIPLNTINHGRCYTLEVLNTTLFYAKDNVVLTFKTNILLFIHGIGQNVGIIDHFFATEPNIYILEPGNNYRVDFEGKHNSIFIIYNCSTINIFIVALDIKVSV